MKMYLFLVKYDICIDGKSTLLVKEGKQIACVHIQGAAEGLLRIFKDR